MNTQFIIEFVRKLFTKDNITFVLAVFGSLGTAYTLFSQRRKISISIQFSVSLLALAGFSGYLYFDTLPNTYPNAPTELTLEVSTSRGKAKRIKLSVLSN